MKLNISPKVKENIDCAIVRRIVLEAGLRSIQKEVSKNMSKGLLKRILL